MGNSEIQDDMEEIQELVTKAKEQLHVDATTAEYYIDKIEEISNKWN